VIRPARGVQFLGVEGEDGLVEGIEVAIHMEDGSSTSVVLGPEDCRALLLLADELVGDDAADDGDEDE